MSKRREWLFLYPGSEILDAVRGKLEYHRGRQEHWESELADKEEELQSEGVSFKAQKITGGRRLDVSVDSALEKQYNRASDKVDRHRDLVEGYSRWERALESNKETTFKLDIDDVAFFGL